MEFEYDPAKSAANATLRGLPFDLASEFDFETAHYSLDTRKDYGEERYQALGYLHGRLHVLVFTHTGRGLRIISLRRANQREARRYAQEP